MVEGERGVEVGGRTVDEAVQKGLVQLSLRRDQVDVEILSDGARTLLGFRPGQVRVRITPRREARAMRPTPEPKPGPPAVEEPPEEEEPVDVVGLAQEILTQMLRWMGIRASVETEQPSHDEPIRLNIRGQNLGALIGRRGETLSSLQFLTRMMVSHQVERWVNLIVDVDDYRRKREDTLKGLAQRMAETALRTGRVQELEPMPPSERRIIHLALRDFDGAKTESKGEGEARRVTIIPTGSHSA